MIKPGVSKNKFDDHHEDVNFDIETLILMKDGGMEDYPRGHSLHSVCLVLSLLPRGCRCGGSLGGDSLVLFAVTEATGMG